MEKLLFSSQAYLTHWLQKEDRYSQHSPFVFDLYSRLRKFLSDNSKGDPEIENFRRKLLSNPSLIQVIDLGAGSKKVPYPVRQIAAITKHSTSSAKFSQLYQFFCQTTPANYVLELGTCMGISTRYLSKSTRGILYSLEGSEEIQKVAQQKPCPTNTTFILGPISETLPKLIQDIPKVDFALLDANHTYRSTMEYYELILPKTQSTTILAIGDIHWSREMERAWEEIKSLPEVALSIDFFECGILFFSYPGTKSDLILDI